MGAQLNCRQCFIEFTHFKNSIRSGETKCHWKWDFIIQVERGLCNIADVTGCSPTTSSLYDVLLIGRCSPRWFTSLALLQFKFCILRHCSKGHLDYDGLYAINISSLRRLYFNKVYKWLLGSCRSHGFDHPLSCHEEGAYGRVTYLCRMAYQPIYYGPSHNLNSSEE